MNISDEEFDQIISEVMDELPKDQVEGLKNIAITYEDTPSPEQKLKLKLRCDQLLFGLYEGVPLPKKPSQNSILGGPAVIMPDKITLFKNSLLAVSADRAEFKRQVKHTLWHEIAHYYGLDHDRIHAIERGEV